MDRSGDLNALDGGNKRAPQCFEAVVVEHCLR